MEWLLPNIIAFLLAISTAFAWFYIWFTKSSKRKLVILDMNGLLVYRAFKPTLRREHPEITQDMLASATLLGKHYTWLRPGAKEFVQELFKLYDVAVWSSAMSDNVSLLAEHVFGAHRAKLAFEWSQSECEHVIPHPDPKETKPLFTKPLFIVEKGFPGKWTMQDMLILDDSPLKMRGNPPYSVLITREWSPCEPHASFGGGFAKEETLGCLLLQIKERLK